MKRFGNTPRIRALLSALCGALLFPLSCPAQDAVVWERIGHGIDETNFKINGDSIISSSIAIVRADQRTHRVGVIRASEFGWKRATVQALCKSSGATACVNANFFDEQDKALGLVISRGIMHQKIHKGGGLLTGVLYWSPKAIGISHRDEFSAEGVVEAVQAGPRLVSKGTVVEGLKESSRSSNLSGICLDNQGHVLLFRVSSGVFGGSLHQLQSVLTTPTIGCVEALNFDGGGSSSMYFSGEVSGHAGAIREENFPGTDEVPVAVGLFPIQENLDASEPGTLTPIPR